MDEARGLTHTVSRDWLTLSWRREISLKVPLHEGMAAMLMAEIVESRWFEQFAASRELMNLDGLDGHQIAEFALSQGFPDTGDDRWLWSINGRFSPDGEHEIPFRRFATSNFERFDGHATIVSRSSEGAFGSLPYHMPTQILTQAIPLLVTSVAVGFNIYRPRGLSSLLPLSPVALESVAVLVTELEWRVVIQSTARRKTEALSAEVLLVAQMLNEAAQRSGLQRQADRLTKACGAIGAWLEGS